MSLRERFARRRIRQRRRLVVKQLTYSNPYYPTTGRQEQRFQWRRAKTVIAAAAILVAVYSLFFSPWLYIKGVTVDGNRRVAGETVSQAVESYVRQPAWLVFKRGHRLWFRSAGLERRLQDEIGRVQALDSITVDRHGATVAVQVKETEPEFVWASGDDYSLLDESGVLTSQPETLEEIPVDFPVIDDPNTIDVEIGQHVLTADITTVAGNVQREWADLFPDNRIIYAELPELACAHPTTVTSEEGSNANANTNVNSSVNSSANSNSRNSNLNNALNTNRPTNTNPINQNLINQSTNPIEPCTFPLPVYELHIVTNEGWRLFVSADRPVRSQLEEAAQIIHERFPDSRKGLDYIDTRFAGRIYYQ